MNLKDHKPNYKNSPTFRLLNPNKGELGKISKQILSRVNTGLREKLRVNQWRNTYDVLQWFNKIENKSRKHFIQHDIVDFYPSINEKLLKEALEYASTVTDISNEEKNVTL